MGEVYRARDSKLGRDVALKVLPGEFSLDPQRMARFEREAQLLAALNHPNIAGIYGLEDSGTVRALVMELVEGDTLAERIRRGPLPLEEALQIALHIAIALEYAHERGIIHRDLKPANIKITPNGTAKVLDFGLAKAVEGDPSAADPSSSPTMSRMATQAGIILGTAAYMSPEQARGKPADRRADIWAFGCVLFEMLSGNQPFSGETVSDALASIIKEPPDWSQLPKTTPARLRDLLERCLKKDYRQRLQSIGDARITLEEVIPGTPEATALAAATTPAVAVAQPAVPAWRRLLPWALAAILSIALFVTALERSRQSAPQRPVNLALLIPADRQLDLQNGPGVVLSPDGSRAAYVLMDPKSGTNMLYLREMDQPAAVPLEGTTTAAAPFFSPDSQWIAFFSDGKLKKVSVRGGAPVALCNISAARGGDWGSDGTIVLTPQFTNPLIRIPAAGGAPQTFTHLDTARSEITHRWPQFLPGGKTVLFTASADNNFFGHANVVAAPLDTGVMKVLVENAYFGRYLPGGYLTYVSQGSLFMVPFDAQSLKVTGTAIPVLKGVVADASNGSAQFSAAENGSVAYLTGDKASRDLNIVRLDRKGNSTVLLKDQADASSPRFSPDGKRLAFQRGAGGIWVLDLARGTTTPVTPGIVGTVFPTWTPDGQRIAYAHEKGAAVRIYWKRADGTGEEEPLTPDTISNAFPSSWSPDGKILAFYGFSKTDGSCCEVWTVTLDDKGKPQEPQLFAGAGAGKEVTMPSFSPDGRWLAYSSEESGVLQVYVAPYPGGAGKWQVSTDGGMEPHWSHSGHELFYASRAALMAVPYSVEKDSFQPGKPQAVFQGSFEMRLPLGSYDVTPDGSQFVVFQFSGGKESAVAQPTVVLHWLDEARRIVAAGQTGPSK